MTQSFHLPPIERLQTFFSKRGNSSEIQILTPDASTREYFRVQWEDSTAIACVYPEPFDPLEQSYLDVTKLFRTCDLPVAQIYEVDDHLGIIVLEDFGDIILRDFLGKATEAKREELINQAISLIAKIQAATNKAFELKSIASRLKFDEEKLFWELNFFKTHYFETFRKEQLPEKTTNLLDNEFSELSIELSLRAKVLCHRDFHTANLMLDKKNQLRIIDHQDARIGAASYDLVSLLLDRTIKPPSVEWLNEKKSLFLRERKNLNLETIAPSDFDWEFDLVTVQRCLKAIGTFSFQSVNRGKTYFLQYIEPMFHIVLGAAQRLDKFPNLCSVIESKINC